MSNLNDQASGREPAPHARGGSADSDFVFDLRTLSRQAGSYRDENRTATVPRDLNEAGLAGVSAGTEITLDLRFEAVSEGVLVTGSAVAPLTGECARCLDPLTSQIEVSIQELYRYLPEAGAGGDDEEEHFLDGDRLNLEPAVRDAVVLALPLSPLCRDDCSGLCAECGVNLAEAGADHGHGDAVDPRWGALRQFDVSNRVEDRQES